MKTVLLKLFKSRSQAKPENPEGENNPTSPAVPQEDLLHFPGHGAGHATGYWPDYSPALAALDHDHRLAIFRLSAMPYL